MLYRTPLRMLSDLVSPKALERIFDSGARARGKTLADLNHTDIADLLKRDVFKRLQLSVPAPLAKKRVQDVLDALDQDSNKNTAIRNEDSILVALEGSARRFSLYFDWPEVQKLRALLNVARNEMDAGKSVPGLLDEGMGLVATLERRLSEGLVTQAQDIAELKSELKRFSGIGGPKLRRLEGLIAQVEEAQVQDTLSPAEVERARRLALDLRKLVESSVVADLGTVPANELPDASLLAPETAERLRELDRESEARDLADLARDQAVLLRVRADLARQFEGLAQRAAEGQVLGPALPALREAFAREHAVVLAHERERLSDLGRRLEALGESGSFGAARSDARLALQVARGTLEGGALAPDELARLESIIGTLEASATQVIQDAERTERLLALTRDTYELESAARAVRGASEALAPRIVEARAALERGEVVSLDDLWAELDQRMAALARERDELDERAEKVVQEYDEYRNLAGETIVKLGRLADFLRRSRRLGQLSIEARAKYEKAIVQAEALLGEARAEFQAARELTSTFGADALSDLLGVFDASGGGLFGEPTPPPADPLANALEGLRAPGGELALLRGERVTWGQLEDRLLKAARDLAALVARSSGAQLGSLDFEHGCLFVLPLDGAALVAHIPSEGDVAAWRDHLLTSKNVLRAG
ncbi:hypothetical protein [Deinococcus yavapaiensis]|uniref:Uncharacterized protein n=1 Tax=Deinococcus yavapaiensis KR-236 TaxID=694435 RepID=A0A318SBF7_9DEIO|nr:hypothetical protein [Deinococcus yavapaiensis]PYE55694.1 hypothetical protein DES52_10257 [Deinococcus yavapaiensis KR-236]